MTYKAPRIGALFVSTICQQIRGWYDDRGQASAPELVFVGGFVVSLDGDGTPHFWNLETLKLEKTEPWGARSLALDAERTALIVNGGVKVRHLAAQ